MSQMMTLTRPLFRRSLSTEGPLRLPHQNKRRASTTLPRTSPKTDAGKHRRFHFLLKRRSQSRAFESPGNPTRHRGTTPEALLLPGLEIVCVSRISVLLERRLQLVSSLGGATRQVILVCPSLQAGHSFRTPEPLTKSGEGKCDFSS